MNGWSTRAIQTLVNAAPKTKQPLSDTNVWNLNLDQIECHGGRVLEKVYVSTEKLGPSTFAFESRTVLYSKLRPYLNKVVVADEAGFATTELVPLRCNPDELHPEYLAYFLRSEEFLKFATEVVAGAKMPRMVMSEFWNFQVPLPPLPEQRRIAAILDQADALRVKRREALAQLDSLTQSIFIEMFGDPSTNPNKFKVHSLGSICDVRDGTHDSPKYESSGFPLVTTKNLRNGVIDFTDVNLISETDYTAINKRSKVDKGDILMPMIGTIGSPILVCIEPNFAIKNMALIKFTKDSPHSQFILSFLKSAAFEKLVASESKGGTQKFLSLGAIRGLQIPVPPRTLQKEFTTAMEAVQLQIIRTLNSLSAMEILFSSLQHRAFRGEL